MGPGVRGVVVRFVLGAALFFPTLPLSEAPGHAQSAPPLPGFVPPYEITRIVRTAGFDPLARPLREGTTYVVRATDFRGILMRVVVDARSGAVRAVNRIASDQGMYGAVGMLPSPYGVPQPYSGPAAAYAPPEFEVPDIAPGEEASVPAAPGLLGIHPVARPLVFEPPLPRPRPRAAALAAHKSADGIRHAVAPSPVQLPD